MRSLCGLVIVVLAFAVPAANSSATAQGGATAQAAPRLSADDYRGFMKTVGSTYPSMQKHLMGGMTAEAAKEAQTLATTFGNVERFWMQNNKADAVKFAQDARKYATEAAGAATAGDAAKASMAAGNMQGMCKQCHGMYREMDPANPIGFRIKPGVIAGS
jgi:cytochrome c556